MSSTAYSQKSLKPTQPIHKRSVPSVQKYFLLFKLIAEYANSFENQMESKIADTQCSSSQSQRIERINAIINFTDRLRNQQSNLQESDRYDCLIQSLHIIKKLNRILTKNEIETRSKRLSFRKEQQTIQQLQRSAMQKVAQLLLTSLQPKKKSLKAIVAFISVIIGELTQYFPTSQEKNLDKQKTKKPLKKLNLQYSPIQCFLQSGSKMNLVCYLVFRILQKNLQQLHQIKENQDKQAIIKDLDQISVHQLLEKYVNQYINEVITKVLIQQFQEINLLKLFLSCAVQNIHQMQLPIIPFFLSAFNQIMQNKFKTYYVVTFDKDQQQKISPRDVFSLQNINILLQLATLFSNELLSLQSTKQLVSTNPICSYCGIVRQNLIQRLLYQKLTIKLSQSHNLVITVCEQCCKSLNIIPAPQVNLRLLGPLILSQFWNNQFDKNRNNQIKNAISNFVRLHPAGKDCFNKKDRFDRIFVSQKIAMNNAEESISKNLVQKVYNTFLFLHSQLSIKSILIEVIQILMICWTSKDEKIREKSIKMLFKSSILQFLYSQQPLFTKQYAQQLKQTADHIIKGLCLRFKDNCASVAFVSLQYLVKLYVNNKVGNEIFEDVFINLIESKNIDFQIKAFDALEKLLYRNKNKKGKESFDVVNYTLLNIKMLTFCLESQKKNGQSSIALTEKVSKIISLLLNEVQLTFQSRYSQSTQQKIRNVFEQFFSKLGFKFQVFELQSISNKILLVVLAQLKLDSNIFKNLPTLSSKVIPQLLQLVNFQQTREQTNQLILSNIVFIIREVYSDTIWLKQHIFGTKKKEALNNKSNLSKLISYVHSSTFVQFLLQPQKACQSKSQMTKLKILNQLLYLNNLNYLFSSQKQIARYFSILQKTKRKSAELQNFLSRIILKRQVEQDLEKLTMKLLQKIKQADFKELECEVALIVNIKWHLGKTDQIKGFIQIYENYCIKFYHTLNTELNNYQMRRDQDVYKRIVGKYIALTRCFHITTNLITSYERYLIGQQKIKQFYGNRQHLMAYDQEKRLPFQKINKNSEIIATSLAFKNLYILTINLLQISDEIVRDQKYLLELYQKNFLLLRFYFEVNPKTIFMQSKLLNVLNKINDSQEGFIIIKHMYKLFETLLPTINLQLLNFIRDQFSKNFHEIIRSQYIKKDIQFVETAFSIIYHLLRSGMEGLYTYNKYLYFGLLHSSLKINKITQKLVRQMYSDQASQKMLYLNISQSFDFVYQIFFKHLEFDQFQQILFTDSQKSNLSMLCEMGRFVNGQYVIKNKKQMKLSATFIKKVGDFLGSSLNLIKDRPLFFMFVMKMLKCQKIADFTQLCQIIYCLSRLTITNQQYVENLISDLKEKNSQPGIQHKKRIIHNILAYRQLVSCLAYFTKYKQAQDQVKIYHKLLDNTFSPYTTLREEVELSNLSHADSFITKLNTIQQDINVFIEIVVGGVDYVSKREELQQEECSGSSQTQKTKIKGKIEAKKRKAKATYRPKSVQPCIRSQQAEIQLVQGYKNRLRKQPRKPLNQDLLLES